MKTLLQIMAGFVALAVLPGSRGDTVAATPPAGCFKLSVRSTADSWLSLPLVKRTAALGRVTAAGAGSVTLAITGLTDGAYAPGPTGSYYAQFVSGNLAGLSYRVLGNTAGVFTLATGGDSLIAHPLGTVATGAAGDVVCLRPYWTIGDVFGGDAAALRLEPVTEFGAGPYLAADAVLLFDHEATGTDKRPAGEYAFVTGSGWRKRGVAATDAGLVELPPGQSFAVRRQRAVAAELTLIGYLSPDRLALRIPALATGEERDVAIALGHPADVTLANSGLYSAVAGQGAIEASADSLAARDLVLDFDSSRRGFALPPARRYHFSGTAWLEADTAAGTTALKAGSGYLLRLRGARSVRYWLQLPPN